MIFKIHITGPKAVSIEANNPDHLELFAQQLLSDQIECSSGQITVKESDRERRVNGIHAVGLWQDVFGSLRKVTV